MSRSRNISISFFKRSASLSVVRLLQTGISFLVFWLCSIYLPKDIYGNYQKTFVLLSFFAGFLCLGAPILMASLPAAGSGKAMINILKKAAVIYLIIAVICVGFVLFAMQFASLPTRFCTLFLIFFNASYLLLEIYLIKIRRDTYVLASNFLFVLIYFAIHYYALTQTGFDIAKLLQWLLLLSFARLLFAVAINLTAMKKDYISTEIHATGLYYQQWKFLSLNESLEIVSRQVDKLFLLWLLSAGAFAVYFNGSYEIPLMGILITATGTFITMQTVENQDKKTVRSLLQQSTMVLSCILFPLFFFLFLNANDLFQLIFTGKYNESVPIFMISCCIVPFRIMNYTAILQGYHKGREILIGSIIGLISQIIVSIPLYLVWEVKGVALAFIIGTLVQIIYYLVKTSSLLHSSLGQLLPYLKLFFLFVITGLLSYSLVFILKGTSIMESLAWKGLVCCLMIISAVLVLFRKKNIST